MLLSIADTGMSAASSAGDQEYFHRQNSDSIDSTNTYSTQLAGGTGTADNSSPAASPMISPMRKFTADSVPSPGDMGGAAEVKLYSGLEPEPAAPNETDAQKHLRLRNTAAREFFKTEETYLEQLDALLCYFIYPLIGPGLAANPQWLTRVCVMQFCISTALFTNCPIDH